MIANTQKKKQRMPLAQFFPLFFLAFIFSWTYGLWGLYIIREALFVEISWQTIYIIDGFLMLCASFGLLKITEPHTFIVNQKKSLALSFFALVGTICCLLPLWPAYNFFADAAYGNAQTVTGFCRLEERKRLSFSDENISRMMPRYRLIIDQKQFYIGMLRFFELHNSKNLIEYSFLPVVRPTVWKYYRCTHPVSITYTEHSREILEFKVLK